jgi:hypothetical protein
MRGLLLIDLALATDPMRSLRQSSGRLSDAEHAEDRKSLELGYG